MKKLSILFLLIFITSCSNLNDIKSDITGEVINQIIPVEEGEIYVYFCPRNNCEDKLISLVEQSEKIHCAFYELNLENLIGKLEEKNAVIVVDNDNYEELDYPNLYQDNRGALMHNKFCIFDDEIISTGSFNPTSNGNTRNNNNLVIVKSKTLAKNYEEEFQSFINEEFGKDSEVEFTKLILNNEILIENYFCPEDNCEQHVYDVIENAKERIYFMTFSFTSDNLGDLVIKKSYEVDVKGVFESQSNPKYSEHTKMEEKGLNVIKDNSKGKMHHKVFIVDDITILGSYNPTSNGNFNNDENVLIIYDKEITELFLQEFDYVWNL